MTTFINRSPHPVTIIPSGEPDGTSWSIQPTDKPIRLAERQRTLPGVPPPSSDLPKIPIVSEPRVTAVLGHGEIAAGSHVIVAPNVAPRLAAIRSDLTVYSPDTESPVRSRQGDILGYRQLVRWDSSWSQRNLGAATEVSVRWSHLETGEQRQVTLHPNPGVEGCCRADFPSGCGCFRPSEECIRHDLKAHGAPEWVVSAVLAAALSMAEL